MIENILIATRINVKNPRTSTTLVIIPFGQVPVYLIMLEENLDDEKNRVTVITSSE